MKKKINWFLRIFGSRYRIKHIDGLNENEIIIFGHKIYVSKKRYIKDDIIEKEE